MSALSSGLFAVIVKRSAERRAAMRPFWDALVASLYPTLCRRPISPRKIDVVYPRRLIPKATWPSCSGFFGRDGALYPRRPYSDPIPVEKRVKERLGRPLFKALRSRAIEPTRSLRPFWDALVASLYQVGCWRRISPRRMDAQYPAYLLPLASTVTCEGVHLPQPTYPE